MLFCILDISLGIQCFGQGAHLQLLISALVLVKIFLYKAASVCTVDANHEKKCTNLNDFGLARDTIQCVPGSSRLLIGSLAQLLNALIEQDVISSFAKSAIAKKPTRVRVGLGKRRECRRPARWNDTLCWCWETVGREVARV